MSSFFFDQGVVLRGECVAIEQIGHADAAAADFVLIAGPMPREVVPIDVRPGRSSDIFSIMRWNGKITCARLLILSCFETSIPAASSVSISEISAAGIDHQAVADDGLLAGTQDAAGDQLQDKGFVADPHGVAGVVASLIAHHDLETVGKKIDDLPLSFVPPLRSQDNYIAHNVKTVHCTALCYSDFLWH